MSSNNRNNNSLSRSGNNPLGGASTNRKVSVNSTMMSASDFQFNGTGVGEWVLVLPYFKTAFQSMNCYDVVDLEMNPQPAPNKIFTPPTPGDPGNPYVEPENPLEQFHIPGPAHWHVGGHQYVVNFDIYQYDSHNPPPKNPRILFSNPEVINWDGTGERQVWEDIILNPTRIPQSIDYAIHDIKRRSIMRRCENLFTTLRDPNLPNAAAKQRETVRDIQLGYMDYLDSKDQTENEFNKANDSYIRAKKELDQKVSNAIKVFREHMMSANAILCINDLLIKRRVRAAWATLLSKFGDNAAHNLQCINTVVSDLQEAVYNPKESLVSYVTNMEILFGRWAVFSGNVLMPESQKMYYFKEGLRKCTVGKFSDRCSQASLRAGLTYEALKGEMAIYEAEFKSSAEGRKYVENGTTAGANNANTGGGGGNKFKKKKDTALKADSNKHQKGTKTDLWCQHCQKKTNHSTDQCFSQMYCGECDKKGHPPHICPILRARSKEQYRAMIEQASKKAATQGK
jgi:hypothetical protein